MAVRSCVCVTYARAVAYDAAVPCSVYYPWSPAADKLVVRESHSERCINKHNLCTALKLCLTQ